MTVGCVRGAVVDLAALRDGALDGVEVFADFTADGDANASLFKCGAEARKEFGFQSRGELAELQTGLRISDFGMRIEFASQIVAEADSGAGVIEADLAAALKARTENFELFGSGRVFQA